MITKINKIKGLGIFNNYSCISNLDDFKKFNIIYGWNGSGKTTLTKFFCSLESGSNINYSKLEYDIETTDEGIIKNGQKLSKNIRVFNQDYVENNIEMIGGKANPIFILGEENKKILDEINNYEKILVVKNDRYHKLIGEKTLLEKKYSKTFSDIATIISSSTSGEATRRYDKRDAEAAFKNISTKEILSKDDIEKNRLTLRQVEKPLVDELEIGTISFNDKELKFHDIILSILIYGKELFKKTVDSIIIERLKQNSDISEWVENGIIIHNKHKSKNCEFCNQLLPLDHLDILSKHFNDADKALKNNVDSFIEELRKIYSIIENIKPIDKANLYEEIQKSYKIKSEKFLQEKLALLKIITEYAEIIKQKKLKTTDSLDLEFNIDESKFINSINELNSEFKKHNLKTNNFKKEKEISKNTLEKHFLSTIFDEINNISIRIKICDTESNILMNKSLVNKDKICIVELNKLIQENKAKISSSHKACGEINKGIITFLGRDELKFEVDGDGGGYVIKRGNIIAENLSEGEKTAIAFVYFTIHLKDKEFNNLKGIVVIDDPISSLDSNSIFQAFAFLKNSVKDIYQVFILTHNYDFLRLLLNWLNNINKSQRSYYMINNSYNKNLERYAYIDNLDKTLKEHESEYHFLYKKLKTFQSDGTILTTYHVPNIARKFMETFLMFRVPNNENTFKKLESLNKDFDQNKITAIYKFTNDQSHITGKGFDPSLVAECQKNINWLLELVKTVSPEHFRILDESIII